MTGFLKRLLASTGAPPAWSLVRYLTAGLIVGAVLRGALPEETVPVPPTS